MNSNTINNRANMTGKTFEEFIKNSLESQGYKNINNKEIIKIEDNFTEKVYSTQVKNVCKGIYNTNIILDFLLFNPKKIKKKIIIEAKWQQSSGSVDEKYPYLISNIKEKYPYPTIVIIDGNGYKKGAIEWIKKQIGGNLIEVLNMSSFQKYLNDGKL